MHKPETVIRVDPDHLPNGIMERAGKIIRASGVVIFPAQCLYGVAADAANPAAVEKVFRIKRRPKDNPILVLVDRPEDIIALVTTVPLAAKTLMQAFWPGSLTLVFEAAPHISPILTAGTGKIGIRQPAHPVARALVRAAGRPVTGTSANMSGRPGCSSADNLAPSIIQEADLVLDAGRLAGGIGSSIVDVTGDPVEILREGAVSAAAVYQALTH